MLKFITLSFNFLSVLITSILIFLSDNSHNWISHLNIFLSFFLSSQSNHFFFTLSFLFSFSSPSFLSSSFLFWYGRLFWVDYQTLYVIYCQDKLRLSIISSSNRDLLLWFFLWAVRGMKIINPNRDWTHSNLLFVKAGQFMIHCNLEYLSFCDPNRMLRSFLPFWSCNPVFIPKAQVFQKFYSASLL